MLDRLVHGHGTPLHVEQQSIYTLPWVTHLGLGCPANHVQPYAYQFTYRVTECGIRAKAISQDMVLYSSEIYYTSKHTSSKYVIPVSCTAPLCSPWLHDVLLQELSPQRRVTTRMARHAMKCSPCHSPAKGPTAIVCPVSTMKEGRGRHVTKWTKWLLWPSYVLLRKTTHGDFMNRNF